MASKVEFSKLASRFTIVLSFITFFIGGAIYLLFRTESLRMFKWVEFLGLKEHIEQCRELVPVDDIPDFAKYSLPDGLWLFSYIVIIGVVWDFRLNKGAYILSVLPVIAIGSELLQYFGCMRGTFDVMDMVAYFLAYVLGILYIIFINYKLYETLEK